MGRKLTISAAVLGLTVLVTLSAPLAANAGTTYDDGWSKKELPQLLVDKLDGDDDTVIGPEAKLSNEELLDDAVSDFSGTVVAVKKSTLEGRDPEDFARFLDNSENGSYEGGLTLLVVNTSDGDEIYPVAKKAKYEAAADKILGVKAGADHVLVKDAGWTILKNADKLHEARQSFTPRMPIWVILIFFPGIPLLCIGIPVSIVYGPDWASDISYAHRKRKNKRSYKKNERMARKQMATKNRMLKKAQEERARKEAQIAKERNDSLVELTPELQSATRSLTETAGQIRSNDKATADAVSAVLSRFDELREALTLVNVGNKKDILFVEYGKRFASLVELMGPRYYQDIKAHPAHWRNPDWKLTSIVQVFQKTDEQILESIIQLKEGAEFEFELSVDSILGFELPTPRDILDGKVNPSKS